MKITIYLPGEEPKELPQSEISPEHMFEAGKLFAQAEKLPVGCKFRIEDKGLYYEVGKA